MTIVHTHTRGTRRLRWSEAYPVICLIMLSVSPAFLLGEGNRNLGLIAFMLISPMFLARPTVSTHALFLIGFALSIVFLPPITHDSTIRWSTIIYSLMFCALFLAYEGRLKNGRLRITTLVSVLRYLILTYALFLFIQQICVLLNLPIFNLSNYDPENRWKLNALAAEPSHTGRIVGMLMISYITCNRLAKQLGLPRALTHRQTLVLWFCFLWTMLTIQSATAIFMLIVVLGVQRTKIKLRDILLFVLIASLLSSVLPEQLISRPFNLIRAVFTFDYEQVLLADHSGGVRIAPMIVLATHLEILSYEGFFGNGIDSTGRLMSEYIWGVEEGFSGGGLLSLWYEYGFIIFMSFVIFSMKVTSATNSLSNFSIWFLLVFLAAVNSQMTWLTICLMCTVNVFQQEAKHIEQKRQ